MGKLLLGKGEVAWRMGPEYLQWQLKWDNLSRGNMGTELSWPNREGRMESEWDSFQMYLFFFGLFNHSNDLKKLYQWDSKGFGYIHRNLVTNSLISSQKKIYLQMIQSAVEAMGFIFCGSLMYLTRPFCSRLDVDAEDCLILRLRGERRLFTCFSFQRCLC